MLVLLVLIAACYFMWRPASSSASVSRCGYKQQPTEDVTKEKIPEIRPANQTGGLSAVRLKVDGRRGGARRGRGARGAMDMPAQERKSSTARGRGYRPEMISVDRNPNHKHRRVSTGQQDPRDAIGCGSGLQRVHDRHLQKLPRHFSENKGVPSIAISPHIEAGEYNI